MGVALNFEEIIRIGIEIEKNGCDFYKLAAEKIDDAKAKKFLTQLASWEVEHVSIFEQFLQDEQCDTCVSESWYEDETAKGYFKSIADSHIFLKSKAESVLENCDTIMDVLKMALQFEKDSIVLYESLKSMVSTGCDDREKVQHVIDEEIMHVSVIQKEIQKLTV